MIPFGCDHHDVTLREASTSTVNILDVLYERGSKVTLAIIELYSTINIIARLKFEEVAEHDSFRSGAYFPGAGVYRTIVKFFSSAAATISAPLLRLPQPSSNFCSVPGMNYSCGA